MCETGKVEWGMDGKIPAYRKSWKYLELNADDN